MSVDEKFGVHVDRLDGEFYLEDPLCSDSTIERGRWFGRERAEEILAYEGWIGAVYEALGEERGRATFIDDAVASLVADYQELRARMDGLEK